MTDAYADGRTLVLLRHSKAEQSEQGPDADRPLTDRGRADAESAGAWLAKHGLLPDVVLCSTARRTRETWHGVAMGMTGSPPEGGPAGPGPDVRYEPDAYEAHPEDLLTLVRRVDPAARTVLLIAHNPAISLLSAVLDPGRANPEGLRTTGIAVHRSPRPWAELDRGGAPLSAAYTARS
ncbi:SixA phosphatase family protein [Micromonospora globbae]|uniref:SixA phosphatase family protein n=1 Tax=Micromonospora globbae TaxID=1894969 RepID=UPI00342202EF